MKTQCLFDSSLSQIYFIDLPIASHAFYRFLDTNDNFSFVFSLINIEIGWLTIITKSKYVYIV